MACKIALFTTALFLVISLALAAPTSNQSPETLKEKDLEAGDKGDLKTAASHWGGWGGYGGYGGFGGYGGWIGGHYPYYGYYGWPSYGWPYGFGGYGHYGYWL